MVKRKEEKVTTYDPNYIWGTRMNQKEITVLGLPEDVKSLEVRERLVDILDELLKIIPFDIILNTCLHILKDRRLTKRYSNEKGTIFYTSYRFALPQNHVRYTHLETLGNMLIEEGFSAYLVAKALVLMWGEYKDTEKYTRLASDFIQFDPTDGGALPIEVEKALFAWLDNRGKLAMHYFLFFTTILMNKELQDARYLFRGYESSEEKGLLSFTSSLDKAKKMGSSKIKILETDRYISLAPYYTYLKCNHLKEEDEYIVWEE